ncbi:unnamed protein product [Orchesella dallaii]
MTFNTTQQVQTITLFDDALPMPAIPQLLHSTGDVVVLISLLTHCIMTKDIYLRTIIRMPVWIFFVIVSSGNLRFRDERCAVLQELIRLSIIVYYGLKLNFFKFPRSLRSRKESTVLVQGESSEKLQKSERLSEEEIQKFYRGVPTLIKRNEPVAFDTLPYDKTLEISQTHFTANKSQRCVAGHNGISFQGTLNYNSKKIRACIKTNIPGDISSLHGLMKEIKLLKYVGQHDNLQSIFGAYTTELSRGKLFLVLENCGPNTLSMQLQQLQDNQNALLPLGSNSTNEDLLVDFYRWAYEISSGMNFISGKGIVHGSLSCDCILLNEAGTVKLTDFGTAPYLSNPERFQPEQYDHDGWKYLAPEAILKNEFTTSGDIWSFGIVLWKIFTVFSEPYPAFDTYSKIFSLSLLDGMRPEAEQRIPDYISLLLEKCWLHESQERPTFEMCCQYTYVKTKPKRRIVTCDGDFIT